MRSRKSGFDLKTLIYNFARFIRRKFGRAVSSRSLFEAILLSFIKLIHANRSKIYNFRTAVSVLLLLNAFSAVIGVGDSWPIADKTAVVIGTIIAFIANANENSGSDVGVADYTLSFAFFAKASDGNSPLLPAHDEIRVMLGHLL